MDLLPRKGVAVDAILGGVAVLSSGQTVSAVVTPPPIEIHPETLSWDGCISPCGAPMLNVRVPFNTKRRMYDEQIRGRDFPERSKGLRRHACDEGSPGGREPDALRNGRRHQRRRWEGDREGNGGPRPARNGRRRPGGRI